MGSATDNELPSRLKNARNQTLDHDELDHIEDVDTDAQEYHVVHLCGFAGRSNLAERRDLQLWF